MRLVTLLGQLTLELVDKSVARKLNQLAKKLSASLEVGYDLDSTKPASV